jgi:hypothetical protein
MTEIREPHFRIDLPGEWEETESAEEGAFVYRETQGDARLSILLLAVKPMFAIADQKRLLEDYMSHRSKYERGQIASLVQSEPVSIEHDGVLEGGWSGADPETGRLFQHQVVLASGVLGHFAYEDAPADASEFAATAAAILSTAAVRGE